MRVAGARDRRPRRAAAASATSSREIAAALPLQIICDMMGIPREDTKRIFELTNTILGVGDPEYVQTHGRPHGRGHGAVPVRPRARRGPRSTTRATTSRPRSCRPRSRTRTAATGSHRASSARSSCCSSSPATRRRATRSATACTRSRNHPDQRALWIADFDGGLADRGRGDRALGDAGHPLPAHRDARHRRRRPGDQGRREGRDVLQLGQPRRARSSPTRTASTSPARRTSTSGFGAGGPHFCLGANLARREIKVMFEELFRGCPTSRSPASPTCCRAGSSTASSACRAPGEPQFWRQSRPLRSPGDAKTELLRFLT